MLTFGYTGMHSELNYNSASVLGGLMSTNKVKVKTAVFGDLFSALILRNGQQKGIWPVKNLN